MNKKVKGVNILPDEVLDLFIEKTQASINSLVEKQVAIEPALEAAKAVFEEAVARFKGEYEKVQEIWDEQQAVIDKEQTTLQLLLRQKAMGVYEEEEDGEKPQTWRNKKRRPARYRINWVERVRDLLKESQRFSELEFLINKIVAYEVENGGQIPKDYKHKSTYYVKTRAMGSFQGLSWYDGLIGLDEWMDGEQPKQEYLKYKQLQTT